MHSRGARLARGWVVAAFATAIAALSHALAGGSVPSGLALAAGLVFSGLLGTLLMGRTPSLPRLAGAVLGGQLAFHLGFSYLGTAASITASHHATSMTMTMDATAHHHADGAGMWVAHTVAALVTLGFLLFAERAVWSLLTQLARMVVAPFRISRTLPVRAARPAPLPVFAPSLLVGRLFDTLASRRGPPLSLAF